MKFSSFSALMTTMMTDTMDIYRYVETTNADGTTSLALTEQPLHADVYCRLSFSAMDNPKDEDIDQNPIRYSPVVFCPSTVDIKAGDELVVRRIQDDGSVLMTYKGQAGQPASYPTHKETRFFIAESA